MLGGVSSIGIVQCGRTLDHRAVSALRLLPYLHTHLTIGEIGERLFGSRSTVNTEVGSIYRKLGVFLRNNAVQQGTAIGLLGG